MASGHLLLPTEWEDPAVQHLGQPWSLGTIWAALLVFVATLRIFVLCVCYLGAKTTCLAQIHSLPLPSATPSLEGPGPFRKRGKEVSDGRAQKLVAGYLASWPGQLCGPRERSLHEAMSDNHVPSWPDKMQLSRSQRYCK